MIPPHLDGDMLCCLQCITEYKVAEHQGIELPDVKVAITLVPQFTPAGVCAVPTCWDHIVVQKQSPLQVPNGTPRLLGG